MVVNNDEFPSQVLLNGTQKPSQGESSPLTWDVILMIVESGPDYDIRESVAHNSPSFRTQAMANQLAESPIARSQYLTMTPPFASFPLYYGLDTPVESQSSTI